MTKTTAISVDSPHEASITFPIADLPTAPHGTNRQHDAASQLLLRTVTTAAARQQCKPLHHGKRSPQAWTQMRRR